jgi:hypothetical protein
MCLRPLRGGGGFLHPHGHLLKYLCRDVLFRRKPKERHCYSMSGLRLSLRPPFSVEFLIVWILIATKLSFMFEYGVFPELAAH